MLDVRVLHVRLDEPGGGGVYVRLALGIDAPGYEMFEVASDPRRLRRSPLGWWRAAAAIRRMVRSERISIVHAHGVRAGSVALLGSAGLRIKRVLLIHGLHSVRRASRRSLPFVCFVNRFILRSFDQVMVLSKSDRDAIIGSRLASRDKIRIVRTTFNPPAPPPRAEARRALGLTGDHHVVIWIGRFSEEKDPLTFARAVTQLRDEVAAVMIGDGPLMNDARAIAAGSDIVFTGWLDDPSVGYAVGDILVNSSRWEGLPLAVLEAASVGLRLVRSDRPGNRDVAAMGVPARSFPFGDAFALAAAISEEVQSPAPAGAVRDIILSSFNAKALKEDLLRVYAELEER